MRHIFISTSEASSKTSKLKNNKIITLCSKYIGKVGEITPNLYNASKNNY